jgi:putative sugar O-methyltransferase
MTHTKTHQCVQASGTGRLPLTLVRRIRAAYLSAIKDYRERQSDLWSYIATRTRDIHQALMDDDENRLADLLSDPGSNNLFLGFDNLFLERTQDLIRAADGAPAWAAQIVTMIGQLAESVAAKRIWQPECGTAYAYYDQSQSQDVESLIGAIARRIGRVLTFPNPFPNEFGVATSRGIVSHRALHAVYYASRLSMLRGRGPGYSILEIGAGMGRTAAYVREWALGQYTIVDLPMANVAQAVFLGAVVGEDAICLTGESRPGIRLFTPQWLVNTRDRFDIVLNTDSLTEMPLETAVRYAQIAMDRAGKLLSINHEGNDVLVHELAP